MAENKVTKEICVELLQREYVRLQSCGEERYPQRSDFTHDEVVAIKAFLGPWPRALEAAGIKPPRDDDPAQKKKEMRIRAKRNRTAFKKQQKSIGEVQ